MPAILLAFIVTGCSGKKSEEEYLSLAKSSIAAGEVKAAIINLKNALSVNGESSEGRLLLGQSYLSLGLWISAEKELTLAYHDGYQPELAVPAMAKVYYHLGDTKGIEELLAQLDLLPENTRTILKTFAAITYIKEQDLEQGLIYLYDVVDANITSEYTQLSQAWKYGMDGKTSEAIAVIDNVLISKPKFAEAIEYKAYLHFKAQEMALAADSFGQYIEIHPQAHELRMMFALSLVYSEQYQQAEQQVDLLLKGMPKNPKLNQLKAQTRFANKDYEQAKQYAEVASRGSENLVLAKVIAGISAYQLNQKEVAYSHLNSVNNRLSAKHPAKKLLNALKFELGYENDVFTELLNTTTEGVDVDTLSFSANELFKLGKVEEANSLLTKASEKEPKNADVLYQQGLLKLFDQDSSATTFFEKALEKNPELESAMSMLILERLKENKFEKAFEIANSVAEENPELAFIYKGVINVRQGNYDKAKNEFKQALSLNNNNAGTYFKLGQVFELEENLESAVMQYQQALKANVKFPLAASALLKISKVSAHKQNVQYIFETIVKENKNSVVSYSYLALFHAVQQDLASAELVLDEGLKQLPNNTKLLMLKGKVQANNQDYDSALASFDNALKQNAFNANYFIAKANVFSLQKRFNEAIEVQKSAIELMPNVSSYKVGLARLHIKNNELPEASKILRSLKQAGKSDIAVERLMGKVAFLNNNYTQAYSLLSNVAQTVKAADVMFELASSLQQLKRSAEALAIIDRFEEDKESAMSLDLLLKHAELLETNNPEKALAIYNNILDKTNRHFAMLNNIAMIHLQQGDTKQALKFAKESYSKAKDHSAIQNTYGLTLLAVGDINNSVIYLEKAYKANPKNVNYAVHYAQALLANNQKKEAEALIKAVDVQLLNKYSMQEYNVLIKAFGL